MHDFMAALVKVMCHLRKTMQKQQVPKKLNVFEQSFDYSMKEIPFNL